MKTICDISKSIMQQNFKNIYGWVFLFVFTCFAISLKQATPRSKLGKATEPYFWYSGIGLIFIVASVITPRVPEKEGGIIQYITCQFSKSYLNLLYLFILLIYSINHI